MTTASFKYIDPTTFDPKATAPFEKAWTKVDGAGWSFKLAPYERKVENMRGQEEKFHTDITGFSVHHWPSKEKTFTDESAIREKYYKEVEEVLRAKLGPGVKKITIFDHTIRRRNKNSPRQPVQQVHVDQTPAAAEVRVRRHHTHEEAERLLKGRYQLINVWRPIENPATDFPLAVVDFRTIDSSKDLVPVDLLYPIRDDGDDDDRGKEKVAAATGLSTDGYAVKGETFGVAPNDGHRFYYYKNMTPDETMFIKCFDSWGEGLPEGKQGIARCTPHTAFEDPATPADAPGRQSIEVRTLVFYEE